MQTNTMRTQNMKNTFLTESLKRSSTLSSTTIDESPGNRHLRIFTAIT